MGLFGLPIALVSGAASFPTAGGGGYRPPQWGGSGPSSTQPALTMLTTDPTSGQQTAYVFDCIEDITHEAEERITRNPVQTGSAISDHAYAEPMRVTAELIMSDALQSFTIGQFANGPSRSVAAFQLLLQLKASRSVVQIATRLNTYQNMLIESVTAHEKADTRFGLSATVTFRQIILASVEQVQSNMSFGDNYNPITDSTRPQTTAGSSIVGQAQPQTVPQSMQHNNNIANAPAGAGLSSVPVVTGAGDWSSYPVDSCGY